MGDLRRNASSSFSGDLDVALLVGTVSFSAAPRRRWLGDSLGGSLLPPSPSPFRFEVPVPTLPTRINRDRLNRQSRVCTFFGNFFWWIAVPFSH